MFVASSPRLAVFGFCEESSRFVVVAASCMEWLATLTPPVFLARSPGMSTPHESSNHALFSPARTSVGFLVVLSERKLWNGMSSAVRGHGKDPLLGDPLIQFWTYCNTCIIYIYIYICAPVCVYIHICTHAFHTYITLRCYITLHCIILHCESQF